MVSSPHLQTIAGSARGDESDADLAAGSCHIQHGIGSMSGSGVDIWECGVTSVPF